LKSFIKFLISISGIKDKMLFNYTSFLKKYERGGLTKTILRQKPSGDKLKAGINLTSLLY